MESLRVGIGIQAELFVCLFNLEKAISSFLWGIDMEWQGYWSILLSMCEDQDLVWLSLTEE